MPELEARALIEKHRGRRVLLDSNLLVRLLVGKINVRKIPDNKRTSSYTVDDFKLLSRLISYFGKLVATPHVLSQASDLTDLKGKELLAVRQLLKEIVTSAEEYRDPSAEVVTHSIFGRLGLTDAAVTMVSLRNVLVVTADLDLHLAIQHCGGDAINFNHVSSMNW